MSATKRILCLHGYSQNATRLSINMAPIRKALDNAEFVYVDAPHIATEPRSDQTLTEGKPFGWWNMTTPKIWKDTQESVKYLIRVVEEKGPFDGILGFSQGAAIIPIFLNILNYKGLSQPNLESLTETEKKFEGQFNEFLGELKPLVDVLGNKTPFRFAIMGGGFAAGKKVCLRLLSSSPKLNIPSLHIIGKTDDVISNQQSMQLSQLFNNPEFIMHTGGHVLPITKDFTNLYRNFLPKL